MPSPRKHPSLYPSRLKDLISGPTIIITLPSSLAATNLRYQLYAFRESLRAHPSFAPTLLTHANTTTMRLFDNRLYLVKPHTVPTAR